MAKFYCFVYSGNTMFAKMALNNVKVDEEDIRYQFFKNKMVHLPYANQPAQMLDGRDLPFSAICQLDADMLLVMPNDVEPHLGRFKADFTLVSRVETVSELPTTIFKFLDSVKFD